PSFGRPKLLAKAVASLVDSSVRPEAIWVLFPQADEETRAAVVQLAKACPIALTGHAHPLSGHVGPLAYSTQLLASGTYDFSWCLVMDDDGQLACDALERMLAGVEGRPALAIGGSVQNYLDGLALRR